ncbi:hypothetical protein [Micromonospora peucetia]|uniref:Uncharacterized protein n=1 Tax=Micromonospora peucetia TaxID=47871 RepID=A0ABZ1EF22_9ACTN|nr:hypothetical protein [Micromonospora peucetia]WSA33411.1 hypothetical protein OIE14_04955 [Micromonospora peucetia]
MSKHVCGEQAGRLEVIKKVKARVGGGACTALGAGWAVTPAASPPVDLGH